MNAGKCPFVQGRVNLNSSDFGTGVLRVWCPQKYCDCFLFCLSSTTLKVNCWHSSYSGAGLDNLSRGLLVLTTMLLTIERWKVAAKEWMLKGKVKITTNEWKLQKQMKNCREKVEVAMKEYYSFKKWQWDLKCKNIVSPSLGATDLVCIMSHCCCGLIKHSSYRNVAAQE